MKQTPFRLSRYYWICMILSTAFQQLYDMNEVPVNPMLKLLVKLRTKTAKIALATVLPPTQTTLNDPSKTPSSVVFKGANGCTKGSTQSTSLRSTELRSYLMFSLACMLSYIHRAHAHPILSEESREYSWKLLLAFRQKKAFCSSRWAWFPQARLLTDAVMF